MKTTKLAIGIGGAVMAMAALASPAPAQAGAGGSTGTVGGGGGVITRLVRPIIYEYDWFAPMPERRVHLEIAGDGAVTLVHVIGDQANVTTGHLAPADLAAVRAAAARLLLPGQPGDDVSTGAAAGDLVSRRVLTARLFLPGMPGDDVSTGAAAGDLVSRRVLTMRIGPLAIQHDAAMALPAGRMISQRLDRIIAAYLAN